MVSRFQTPGSPDWSLATWRLTSTAVTRRSSIFTMPARQRGLLNFVRRYTCLQCEMSHVLHGA